MMPSNALSSVPLASAFLPPRTGVRLSSAAGQSDQHYGGVAIGNPSLGISYQLWTAFIEGSDILLQAPNTPAYVILPGVAATWVALAFDQNSRVFIAYSTAGGAAFYYWYDSTISNYTTSALAGLSPRVFAALDDSRPAEASSADILLVYVRLGQLYFRQQRDRFGVEYNLAAAPALLVQIGMNRVNRFQFAFQDTQNARSLPPAEFNPGAVQ
jgi:hypothetical protein